jgi:hypothetical protein
MYQVTFDDELSRRGHLVARTHHQERRVFTGRLPGSELDGAGSACRSIHTHDEEAPVGVLTG